MPSWPSSTAYEHRQDQPDYAARNNQKPAPTKGSRSTRGIIRCPAYADDLVALCHTRDEAEQVKARLAGWLAPRGLAFNEDKTRVVTLDEGFDFLGFTVRRQSSKLLIKPSKRR